MRKWLRCFMQEKNMKGVRLFSVRPFPLDFRGKVARWGLSGAYLDPWSLVCLYVCLSEIVEDSRRPGPRVCTGGRAHAPDNSLIENAFHTRLVHKFEF